jgi:hypothetical protein
VPTIPTLGLERVLLLAWTVALILLVALNFGSIPSSLSCALVPYLALVARQAIAPTDRKTEAPRTAPVETTGPPAGVTQPEAVASPPEPEPIPVPEAIEPDPRPAPARPPPPRWGINIRRCPRLRTCRSRWGPGD